MENILGKNIQNFRQAAKFNKKQLAEAVPCDVSLITRYEKGERQPTLKILIRLAEIFGISLDRLISENKAEHQFAARGSGKLSKEEAREMSGLKQLAENYQEIMKNTSIKTEYQGVKFSDFNPVHIADIKRNLELSDPINYEEIKTALRSIWNIQIFELPLRQRNISGVTFNLENTYICFINKGHTEERKLFSLIHEMYHIIYHFEHEKYLISRLSSRNEQEKKANKFAEEFLIPSEKLSAELKLEKLHAFKQEYISELAGKFNVSPECLFRDLNRKGLVQYHWKSYRPVTDFDKNYPTEWNWNDLPYLYVVGVFYNWKTDNVSLAKAAKYLHSDIRTISDLFRELDEQIETAS